MASLRPRQLRNKILSTLAYFDKYDYPLTLSEVRYWAARRGFNPLRLRRIGLNPIRGYYFLPGRSHIITLRQQREIYSRKKWQIAIQVGKKLSKFPSIAAVFVTGALAMNNCPQDDDIDLMMVTYPNTLWITRFFINLYLHRIRRFPRQSRAPDKVCPNLWLDTDHLFIPDHSLRTAHEILQAKVLWDRSEVHHQFLKQNPWVKEYLPVAYKGSIPDRASASRDWILFDFLLWPINLFFFIVQYLYMKSKMTSERVGLGYAFFHPRG